MISEFLKGRLYEHSLFLEVRGEIVEVLEVAPKVVLVKLLRVAVQPWPRCSSPFGHGLRRCQCPGGRDEAHQHRATVAVTL